MRHSCVLIVGLFCGFLSTVIGSYDGGYAATHDLDDYYEHEPSYPAPPIVHPQHHHGHSAGSYYHYHVPLVGQQHYQPQYHHQDHSHYLWPLLLLLALPLLFLPLLPLLLLPLGLSLLALLAPGGMMMMMMMMMMGGGMMMRTDTISGRAFGEMRTFGEVLLLDMTSLLSKYARSLDLDQCPQRIACEMGAVIFPENNSTDASTAKAFSSFIMEQYFPKGKVRRTIKQYEKAFWVGSSSINSCKAFNCQPTFKVYDTLQKHRDAATGGTNESVATDKRHQHTQPTVETKSGAQKHVNYIYPHSKVNAKTPHNSSNTYLSNYEEAKVAQDATDSLSPSPSPKMKRSNPLHQQRYGDYKKRNVDKTEGTYSESNKNLYYTSVFGTPTIRS